jgi:hypothetical protein
MDVKIIRLYGMFLDTLGLGWPTQIDVENLPKLSIGQSLGPHKNKNLKKYAQNIEK